LGTSKTPTSKSKNKKERTSTPNDSSPTTNKSSYAAATSSSASKQLNPIWKAALQQQFRKYLVKNSTRLEIEQNDEQQKKKKEPEVHFSKNMTWKVISWYAKSKAKVKRKIYEKSREKLRKAMEESNIVVSIGDGEDTPAIEDQANWEMYTDSNQLKRDQNRLSKRVQYHLKRWWNSMVKNTETQQKTVTKTVYMRLLHVIYFLLLPDRKEEQFKEAAKRDWENDSKGKRELTEGLFKDAIFELADIWCESAEENEYIDFLYTLHKHIGNILEKIKWKDVMHLPIVHKAPLKVDYGKYEKKWTKKEDRELFEEIKRQKKMGISEITEVWDEIDGSDIDFVHLNIKNRTYAEIRRRVHYLKHQWSKDDSYRLLKNVDEHGESEWKLILKGINSSKINSDDARFHYHFLVDNWSKSEEQTFKHELKIQKTKIKYKHQQIKQSNYRHKHVVNINDFDWEDISAHLPKKSIISCKRHYKDYKKKKDRDHQKNRAIKPWTNEEDATLFSSLETQVKNEKLDIFKLPSNNEDFWKLIASFLPSRNYSQCKERYHHCLFAWKPDKDAELKKVADHTGITSLEKRLLADQEDKNSILEKLEQSWEKTSRQFHHKSPTACQYRFKLLIREWQQGETDFMFKLTSVMDLSKNNVWNEIANKIDGRHAKEVYDYFKECMKSWKGDEDRDLLSHIQRYGIHAWPIISLKMKNRSAAECQARYAYIYKSWTEKEDRTLCALVKKYGERYWTRIAKQIGTRSSQECQHRYVQLTDWNNDELTLLLQYAHQYCTDKRTLEMIETHPNWEKELERFKHQSTYQFSNNHGIYLPDPHSVNFIKVANHINHKYPDMCELKYNEIHFRVSHKGHEGSEDNEKVEDIDQIPEDDNNGIQTSKFHHKLNTQLYHSTHLPPLNHDHTKHHTKYNVKQEISKVPGSLHQSVDQLNLSQKKYLNDDIQFAERKVGHNGVRPIKINKNYNSSPRRKAYSNPTPKNKHVAPLNGIVGTSPKHAKNLKQSFNETPQVRQAEYKEGKQMDFYNPDQSITKTGHVGYSFKGSKLSPYPEKRSAALKRSHKRTTNDLSVRNFKDFDEQRANINDKVTRMRMQRLLHHQISSKKQQQQAKVSNRNFPKILS